LRRIVSLAFILLLAFVAAADAADERRVALVVGVSAYQHANKLVNTVNDANGIAASLSRLGFDVETVIDPDRTGLEAAVRRLGDRARGADVALFYYAGHALEYGGQNWLVPVQADLHSERDLRFETLDVDAVIEQLEGQSRVSIVVLDACRDNPFRHILTGSHRELVVNRGLAPQTGAVGTLLVYATAPGQVAEDGNGLYSPFTAALLHHLEDPGVEIRRLITIVRAEVRKATYGKQVPWDSSSLEGQFFLRPVAADVEAIYWDSVRNSNDPADLRAYLAHYPNGMFAELARNRIARFHFAEEEKAAEQKAAENAKSLAEQKAAEDAKRLAAQKAAEEPTVSPSSSPPPAVLSLVVPPPILVPPTLSVPPISPATPDSRAIQGLETVRASALAVPCALLDIEEAQPPGQPLRLMVSGPALQSASLVSFLRQLDSPGRSVAVTTKPLAPGQCPAVAVVAELVRRNREQRTLRLSVPSSPVTAGTSTKVSVEVSPNSALYVDLFSPDGSVQHLHRGNVAANTRKSDMSIALVAPGPAGQWLLVAITTAAPINLQQRPSHESEGTYLSALESELARLANMGIDARAEAAALSVVAAPRPAATSSRSSASATSSPRPANPTNPRCQEIVSRVTLGDTLSEADRTILATSCGRR
jgi:hypothetical protein